MGNVIKHITENVVYPQCDHVVIEKHNGMVFIDDKPKMDIDRSITHKLEICVDNVWSPNRKIRTQKYVKH